MSETTDWLDECMGLYDPQESCPTHPGEYWSINDEYGCRKCYEKEIADQESE